MSNDIVDRLMEAATTIKVMRAQLKHCQAVIAAMREELYNADKIFLKELGDARRECAVGFDHARGGDAARGDCCDQAEAGSLRVAPRPLAADGRDAERRIWSSAETPPDSD